MRSTVDGVKTYGNIVYSSDYMLEKHGNLEALYNEWMEAGKTGEQADQYMDAIWDDFYRWAYDHGLEIREK